ncbi:hypothetical protein [Mucilaginibacter flavus]|uniref:hypothetical protein n=1 Tax=Mucilaginibacter flavus TaxID=931504 RepID=UPI0025B327E0|nr:hypothetical protein [Mucilaginibacter flavus]MDN3581043.1 hypothetical protein [Mucilaginibacter flavus]
MIKILNKYGIVFHKKIDKNPITGFDEIEPIMDTLIDEKNLLQQGKFFRTLFSFNTLNIFRMNMEILEKYNVVFYRNTEGKKLTNGQNPISSYIDIWRHADDIEDFLSDVNLCLNGQIELVEDTDYSDPLRQIYGTLTSDNLIVSSKGGANPINIPLADFKILLFAWRAFLKS